MSIIRKVIELLISEPPKVVFEESSHRGRSRRTIAYELNLSLKLPTIRREGFRFEEVPLLESGTRFLSTKEASKRYDLSPNSISKLCKQERIQCKKNKRQWAVNEDSLKVYCEGKK